MEEGLICQWCVWVCMRKNDFVTSPLGVCVFQDLRVGALLWFSPNKEVLIQSAGLSVNKWSLCVFVRDSDMSVSVTGTVQSTSAAFNCLNVELFMFIFGQTFAFHTSALFLFYFSQHLHSSQFLQDQRSQTFSTGLHFFYSVLVEVHVLSGFVIESVLL